MEKRRHFCEIWVVYVPTKRMGRKVFLASDNKETCGVSLPLPRTALTVQERDGFNKVGEESTHDSTYTGVPPFGLGSVPEVRARTQEGHSGFRASDPERSSL